MKILKILKFNILIKILIFYLTFCQGSYAIDECKNNSHNMIDKIKYLEIVIDNERKYLTEVGRKLIKYSRGKNAENKGDKAKAIEEYKNFGKKRRYKSRLVVNYLDGKKCILSAKIRAHGNMSDHIDLISGVPVSSLRVNLSEGNIKNGTKFLLLRPKSRNSDNEIFVSTLLSHLGILSPESFYINIKIHGKIFRYIFQENLKKEFLEKNKRVEGPIIEKKEDFWFSQDLLQMARVTNKKWIKSDDSNLYNTIKAIQKLNKNLLHSFNYSINFRNDVILRSHESYSTEEEFKINSIFEALMFALDARHGLAFDNRRYYFDPVYKRLEPIYYDGMSRILSKIGYNIKNEKYEIQLGRGLSTIQLLFNEDDVIPEGRYNFVTYSAVQGAKYAIDKINNLNKKNFIDDLKSYGVKKINNKELDTLLSFILKRLDLIKNAKISPFNEVAEGQIFTKYSKNMKSLDDDKFLVFLNKIKENNNNLYDIEICNYKLENCKKETIDSKILIKLLDQQKYQNKYSIFIALSKNDYISGKIESEKVSFGKSYNNIKLNNNLNFAFSDGLEFKFDEASNNLNISFNKNTARAIIYRSKLEGVKISMKNFSINNEVFKSKVNGLTGCLTILDTEIKDLNIEAENFNCEDTVNFIRSEGSANQILIKNSISDALDSDFSKLNIKKIKITDSGNDCSDFSFGKYKIDFAELENCGDKAISIGEKSYMNVKNLVVRNSYTGIASKDSSKTDILNSNINEVTECYASYNKKQEFSGGSIIVDKSICKNFLNLTKVDHDSLIQIKN
ncbi:hypothetical protein [Candidatus Pelagibacter communis]|uniref:hypothetical protein n=1 Tax=Pelagibacter ubique TaxID=198252 RepID=UPI00094CAEF6|nr:hypothetical protein [Candidatus Pelagibacter ubique]